MSLKSHTPIDFHEEINRLYKSGMGRGSSTGWASVDDHYTVELGHWTVVTGVPGHGKSEWIDDLMVNLAKQGWQHIVFSPENQPHALHLAKIMEKWEGKPFRDGPTARMTEQEYIESMIALSDHFRFLTVDSEFVLNPKLDAVLEAAAADITEWRTHGKGKKIGLVIDPYNELDHSRPSNMTETEYISQMLSHLRQFARDWKIHIWLVAHPTKLVKDKEGKYPIARLWDIAGSAHFNNKADCGITVHRDVLAGGPVQIHVLKVRFKHIGKPGLVELNYDPITGKYSEINTLLQTVQKKEARRGRVREEAF